MATPTIGVWGTYCQMTWTGMNDPRLRFCRTHCPNLYRVREKMNQTKSTEFTINAT